MIYLIGGMPRVGKSTLAQIILERNKVSWMPLDIVRGALNSMSPDLGIKEGKDWWVSHHDKFFPFIKKLVHRIHRSNMSYTLEGDSFLPAHADSLVKEFGAKAVFLGASKTDVEILKNFKGDNNWIDYISEESLNKLPAWIVQKSEEYKQECEKLGIKYIDVSENHARAIEEAYQYLTK